jgi:hypothetical protein
MSGNDSTPKTFSHAFGFRPGTDLDKLNQLSDELEAEVYAAGSRSCMIPPYVNIRHQTRIEMSRRAENVNEMRRMVVVDKQD